MSSDGGFCQKQSAFVELSGCRRGRYITSNVNITTDEGSVPIGRRGGEVRNAEVRRSGCCLARLLSCRGKKVTAFGILFSCLSLNFQRHKLIIKSKVQIGACGLWIQSH